MRFALALTALPRFSIAAACFFVSLDSQLMSLLLPFLKLLLEPLCLGISRLLPLLTTFHSQFVCFLLSGFSCPGKPCFGGFLLPDGPLVFFFLALFLMFRSLLFAF